MNKLKVGIVCPYDMIKGGGVQEIVKSQAEGLRRRGHTVYIITPRPPKYTAKPPKGMVFIGRSHDLRLPTKTTVQVALNGGVEAAKFLEETPLDVLNFHEPWVPPLGSIMLPKSKSVNVATFHARIPDNATSKMLSELFKPYAKSVIKHVDAFVAASYPGSEYISTMTDKPVTVIPVDVDLSKFQYPDKFDDDRPRKTILYVGRLEGRKGVRYLIQAFKVLQQSHPDVRLDILGQGPLRRKLELLAKDLGVAKKVNFLGFRENKEKIRRFKEADLFCAPSIFGEGFGMVLIEAMATGLPVVAGDNPGYASVMKDFGVLSLIKPQDTDNFARRLELMLYQKELRMAWRKWAKAEVQQYSTERMLDKYEELYYSALKKKRNLK